jgi:hypothetical protein
MHRAHRMKPQKKIQMKVNSLQAHKLIRIYTKIFTKIYTNTDYCLVASCTWTLTTRCTSWKS